MNADAVAFQTKLWSIISKYAAINQLMNQDNYKSHFIMAVYTLN